MINDSDDDGRLYSQTRHEFGETAVNTLEGVLKIVDTLEHGYLIHNKNPPGTTYLKVRREISKLIHVTRRVYMGVDDEDSTTDRDSGG